MRDAQPDAFADRGRDLARQIHVEAPGQTLDGDLGPAQRPVATQMLDHARQGERRVVVDPQMLRTDVERGLATLVLREAAQNRPVAEEGLAADDLDRQPVRLAEEFADERRRRVIVDVVGRTDLFELAVVEDGDPVGQLQRLFLVMRDEDGGVSRTAVQIAQPGAQILAHLGVEPGSISRWEA